ncbi:hypothetical protein BDF14DRAFT_1877529 [Spinellus fusiger]|nr:hypothetical protein BDF14DRAFT_1877529 [Spinellus fusiger]
MAIHHTDKYSRRNSLPFFVRQLLLLMSPTEENAPPCRTEQSSSDENRQSSSPFEDLYFSFPAYEELEPESGCEPTSSSCGHNHLEASSAMKSSRSFKG